MELDWTCVNWDGDLRFHEAGWGFHDFRGSRWTNVNNVDNQRYLLNAYRVLLTRARQGMVLFIPQATAATPHDHPKITTRRFGFWKTWGSGRTGEPDRREDWAAIRRGFPWSDRRPRLSLHTLGNHGVIAGLFARQARRLSLHRL
ncbi:MAG: DNA/RNA helicase domain-containing protein, partial [Acidobacteriota bacterium]